MTDLTETHVYIDVPAKTLLDGRTYGIQQTGDEVLYLLDASGAKPSQIGLLEDLLADGSWSQLLIDGPVDPEVIATALIDLNVELNQIAPTTQWDGTPYVDVAAIGAAMDRQKGFRLKLG